jgi:hypothetical protein
MLWLGFTCQNFAIVIVALDEIEGDRLPHERTAPIRGIVGGERI